MSKERAGSRVRMGKVKRGDLVQRVTVAGPSLARADGYATGAFAMGEAGVRWLESLSTLGDARPRVRVPTTTV